MPLGMIRQGLILLQVLEDPFAKPAAGAILKRNPSLEERLDVSHLLRRQLCRLRFFGHRLGFLLPIDDLGHHAFLWLQHFQQ